MIKSLLLIFVTFAGCKLCLKEKVGVSYSPKDGYKCEEEAQMHFGPGPNDKKDIPKSCSPSKLKWIWESNG